MAHQIQDDGFHEIQLNGKQLVFLFMAATVVSVVIFLCGVLVGRGVRVERGAPDATTVASVEPVPVPAPPASTTPPPPPPAGSDPTAAPPPASDDLSYFSRLEKATAPQEKLKPPAPERTAPAAPREKSSREKSSRETASREPPASREAPPAGGKVAPPPTKPPSAPTKPASAPEPAAAPVREKASPPENAAAARAPEKTGPPQPDLLPIPKEPTPAPVEQDKIVSAEAAVPPSGNGFAVQIAALNVRSEADAIAKRLSSKGYAAYVLSPADGAPGVYRVRVGKFPTRRQAESIAAKLQKEEQFKPWVTR